MLKSASISKIKNDANNSIEIGVNFKILKTHK